MRRAPAAVLAALLLAGCGGERSSTDSASGSPETEVTKVVTEFYGSLGLKGDKACALLSSTGQQEVTALFNKLSETGADDCATAAGASLAGAGALQEYDGEPFGDSLRTATDRGAEKSDLSVTVNGSTAEITINGVSKLWKSATAKKYADAWKIETFVAPDAL